MTFTRRFNLPPRPRYQVQGNTVYSCHRHSQQGYILCLPEVSFKIIFVQQLQQLSPGYEKLACRFV